MENGTNYLALAQCTMILNCSLYDEVTTTDSRELPTAKEDFISTEVGNIFRVVNNVVLSALVGLFGIFANIINMIVFYRQGFTTTTNISFFAMAVSDMGCLITVQWLNICLNPYLEKADMNFIPIDVVYLSGDWFNVCFGRVTSWITVFITAERYLGVTVPLKVKQIITLRRTTIIMILIFTINFSVLLPEYSITYLDWKFVPAKNRTLFGLVYRSYKDTVYGLVFTLSSVSGFVSFSFVIILTALLVSRLERKSKWRRLATAGSDNSENVSSRDKKTVKMIIMIAIILIVCYIPGAALSLVPTFVPEFNIGEDYMSSCYAFWSISYLFSTINSSVNVFLYYTMSTKYRQTFNLLFTKCTKTGTN